LRIFAPAARAPAGRTPPPPPASITQALYRTNSVLVLIQFRPPGQPFTFGGIIGTWPICWSDPNTARGGGDSSPSSRTVPQINCTGLLICVPIARSE
jgi:hypothetical protein